MLLWVEAAARPRCRRSCCYSGRLVFADIKSEFLFVEINLVAALQAHVKFTSLV